MKIGIFDPYLDTMSGGEKYMLSAALCLAKKHEVSIFWDINKKDEIISLAKHRFDFDLTKVGFVNNIFSPHVSFLDRLSQSRQFDRIIYLSDGSIPTVATSLIIHFQSPIEWLQMNPKTYLKSRLLYKVVCNSEFTKHYIDKKFKLDSTIIYPPVDLQGNPDTQKENKILNVGRFGINAQGSSFKKQDILVDAFKKLYESGVKNWKLVLVLSVKDNEKEALESFKELCKGYPIELVINPKNDVLWKEYEQAKIYWHAAGYGEDLEKHPDRAEHFGITTVEAMGMGAVPIVIKAGGQKEIVKENINGYLWETIDELLEKTKLVIKDATTREALGKAGRERAQLFSLDRFCKEFSELIT